MKAIFLALPLLVLAANAFALTPEKERALNQVTANSYVVCAAAWELMAESSDSSGDRGQGAVYRHQGHGAKIAAAVFFSQGTGRKVSDYTKFTQELINLRLATSHARLQGDADERLAYMNEFLLEVVECKKLLPFQANILEMLDEF